jgi:hypothetical protein
MKTLTIVFAAVVMMLVAGCQTSTNVISPRNQLSHSAAVMNKKVLTGTFTVRYYNEQFLPGLASFAVEAKIDGQEILFTAVTAEKVSIGEKVDIVEVDMSGTVPLKYYDYKKGRVLFIKKKIPLK